MEYNKLLERYLTAIKLRELQNTPNFRFLKEISLKNKIKNPFKFVEQEAQNINKYKDDIDKYNASHR